MNKHELSGVQMDDLVADTRVFYLIVDDAEVCKQTWKSGTVIHTHKEESTDGGRDHKSATVILDQEECKTNALHTIQIVIHEANLHRIRLII